MKYRLFVSDFDGTLVKADGTVSEYTRRTIERYCAAGGVFAVCSGRGLSSILQRVRELGLNGLVVGYQGAAIAEIESGKLLKSETFCKEEAAEVLSFLEEKGVHTHMYTLNEYYSNRDDELLKLYEGIVSVRAKVEEKKSFSEMVLRENIQIYKVLAIVRPEEQMALFQEILTKYQNKFYVTRSSEWLIEILPLKSRKDTAVRFLQEYFHIGEAETAAIGDQLNDLPLLTAAGGKFTVQNGVEELKEIARIMPSNEEDGVAKTIEKIMTGELV